MRKTRLTKVLALSLVFLMVMTSTVFGATGDVISNKLNATFNVSLPEDTTKPVINNASLNVNDGLILEFSIDEAIDLATDAADVEISYFTEDLEGNLIAISNTMAGDAPLVKNKLWDGYLWDKNLGINYSTGFVNNVNYVDLIPANAVLQTLVRQGYHHPDSTDMDYVNIDWTKPATYVVKIKVIDNAGNVSDIKEVRATVADTTKPVINGASLVVDNGLLLEFSIDEAIYLGKDPADVIISYFTKDSLGNLIPISNAMAENSPLIKDKTWDGYLWDKNLGVNYSKGTANNTNYKDLIPANAVLQTLVRQGYHQPESSDMDYVNIDWTKPATYVVKIEVIDNAGNVSDVKEVTATVELPVQITWDLLQNPVSAKVGQNQSILITAHMSETTSINSRLAVEVRNGDNLVVDNIIVNIDDEFATIDSSTSRFISSSKVIMNNSTFDLVITFNNEGTYSITAYLIEEVAQ